MIFQRRFREVVTRQLELFVGENAELIDDCHEALRRYDAASRDDAGEHYERFGDCQEELNEALEEMRDQYSSTLEDGDAAVYASVFDRAAAKRFRELRLPR